MLIERDIKMTLAPTDCRPYVKKIIPNKTTKNMNTSMLRLEFEEVNSCKPQNIMIKPSNRSKFAQIIVRKSGRKLLRASRNTPSVIASIDRTQYPVPGELCRERRNPNKDMNIPNAMNPQTINSVLMSISNMLKSQFAITDSHHQINKK